jgi:hypothetical protein
VRLKITKQLAGSIDGLHLGRFTVGEVYDIGTSLANYLLAVGAAEPVVDDRTTHDVPVDHDELLNELRRRLSGGDETDQTRASDRKRRPLKRR